MRIVPQSHSIEFAPPPEVVLGNLERWTRNAYKSEDKIGPGTADRLLRSIVEREVRPHVSTIEHHTVTVLLTTNRGVAHELVRHRVGFSYTQESTRYCNYSKGKFDGGITVIEPLIRQGTRAYELWYDAMRAAEDRYLSLLELGVSPQVTRGVLPNDLKTDIVVTANLQAWRYLFWMRTHPTSHPQMVALMTPVYRALRKLYPPVFDTLPRIGSAKPDWIEDEDDLLPLGVIGEPSKVYK